MGSGGSPRPARRRDMPFAGPAEAAGWDWAPRQAATSSICRDRRWNPHRGDTGLCEVHRLPTDEAGARFNLEAVKIAAMQEISGPHSNMPSDWPTRRAMTRST
jgi:hypothetical protein